MEWPLELREICKTAAQEHRSDINQAVECALQNWRASPGFEEMLDQMTRAAVRNLVYEARADENSRLKSGQQTMPNPVVGIGTGITAAACALTLLDGFTIRGFVLGEITGEQLREFAETELNQAKGHLDVAYFCQMLSPQVNNDQTVREAIDEDGVRAIMNRAKAKAQKKLRSRRQPETAVA